MTDPVVFRPRSGYVFFTLATLGSLIYTYQSFRYFSFASGITTSIWAALVVTGGYLIFIRPKVLIFDEGITITNPLHEVTRSWSEIIAIDVRYTMSIRLSDEVKLPWHRKKTDTVYAFAAPAPGRYHSRSIHQSEIRGVGIDHGMALRPGDSPRSHSGQAAALARLRQQEFERSGNNAIIPAILTSNALGQRLLLVLFLLIAIDIAI
jgi:hypothetical protein